MGSTARKGGDLQEMRVRIKLARIFLVLGYCSLLGTAAPDVRIVPTQAIIRYSLGQSVRPTAVQITSTKGVGAYVLSLKPNRDNDQDAVAFELVLRRIGAHADPQNLLYPPGEKWEGYQRWYFAAADFVHGAAKSIYGTRRVMNLTYVGMVVRSDILKADVERIPGSALYKFDRLDIAIRVWAIAAANT